MPQIEHIPQSKFSGVCIQVETPEGTMFVTIMEDINRKPIGIDIHIGKSGSALRAWTHSIARVINLALDKGASIEDIIVEISGQTSDRPSRSLIANIRSGPEGVAYALMSFKRDRSGFMRAKNGIGDDGENEQLGRGPRLAR